MSADPQKKILQRLFSWFEFCLSLTSTSSSPTVSTWWKLGQINFCHFPPHFSDMNLDFGNDQRQPSIAAVTIKIRRVPSGMSEWLQLPDLLFMMVAYSGRKKRSQLQGKREEPGWNFMSLGTCKGNSHEERRIVYRQEGSSSHYDRNKHHPQDAALFGNPTWEVGHITYQL